LQGKNGASFDLHVRIAPILVVDKTIDVSVGNVHASQKPYVTVDDDNLAVVAEVDAVRKEHEVNAEERIDFDTVFAKLVDEVSPEAMASKVVKNDSNLHTLAGFLDQGVLDLGTRLVFFEDVVLQVDEFFRIL